MAVPILDVWYGLGGPKLRQSGKNLRGNAWWRGDTSGDVIVHPDTNRVHDFASGTNDGVQGFVARVRFGAVNQQTLSQAGSILAREFGDRRELGQSVKKEQLDTAEVEQAGFWLNGMLDLAADIIANYKEPLERGEDLTSENEAKLKQWTQYEAALREIRRSGDERGAVQKYRKCLEKQPQWVEACIDSGRILQVVAQELRYVNSPVREAGSEPGQEPAQDQRHQARSLVASQKS